MLSVDINSELLKAALWLCINAQLCLPRKVLRSWEGRYGCRCLLGKSDFGFDSGSDSGVILSLKMTPRQPRKQVLVSDLVKSPGSYIQAQPGTGTRWLYNVSLCSSCREQRKRTYSLTVIEPLLRM